MLKITIPSREAFNEQTQTFVQYNEITICLEHSLVSISKWESKWHKPFLDGKKKTRQENLDYIKCMTITQNVPDEAYLFLTKENKDQITEYINDTRTATWFTENKFATKKKTNEMITSELVYYWMISYGIPMDAEKWHFNRLLTLIRIFSIKESTDNKMSKKDTLRHYAALNAARRKGHKR